jgi:hypothetical protein
MRQFSIFDFKNPTDEQYDGMQAKDRLEIENPKSKIENPPASVP